MSQKVIVVINPKNGTMEFEVEGVLGGKCAEITEALVQSNEHVETQYTQEYEIPDVLPDYINDMSGER
jgi:hypothetical protein